MPASDDPGLLSVKRIEPKPVVGSGEASLGVDGSEWRHNTSKNIDSNLHIETSVPETSRTMTNLHGESYREHYVIPSKHEPADIVAKELTDDAVIGTDFTETASLRQTSKFAPSGSQIIDGVRFDESTFASQMHTESLTDSENSLVASKSVSFHIPSDVGLELYRENTRSGRNDSTSLASLDNLGDNSVISRREEIESYRKSEKYRREEGIKVMQEKTQAAVEAARLKRKHRDTLSASGSLALGSGNVVDALRMHARTANIYPEGFEERAADEARQEFTVMRKMEEEMLLEIEELELQHQLKLHQKYMEDRAKRKLARQKEMESLKLKEAADEERFRRREEARKLEEKARMAEEADKAAKEEEARKKQAAIREARNEADRARKEKEAKEAEMHRELLELQSMRREERVSEAYEQAVKDQLAREEKARLEKEAKEEAARVAEQLRLIAEEEARQKAEDERRKREEVKRLKEEKKNEDNERKEMFLNDMDVPGPAEEETGEEVTLEEDVPVEEDVLVEEEAPPVEESGNSKAKLRLQSIIRKLISSKSGQRSHPRRPKNSKFFVPMMFGDDFQFDPFAVRGTWAGPPQLEDDDDMPETGFKDIGMAIKEHKILLEKKRKDQLYMLNKPNIPACDWTPMFRVDPVDWEDFFDDEYRELVETLIPADLRFSAPDKKRDLMRGLKSAQDASQFDGMDHDNTLITTKLSDNTSYIIGINSKSITDSDVKIVWPLPLGKVTRKTIEPLEHHYYQIEIADLTSILTIEMTTATACDLIDLN
ncbi:ALO1, partial [Symbiodinium microadriaticum]